MVKFNGNNIYFLIAIFKAEFYTGPIICSKFFPIQMYSKQHKNKTYIVKCLTKWILSVFPVVKIE